MADKLNRSLLIFGSVTLWSLCTLLTGLIENYYALFVLRFLLGLFMAFFNPSAYSLISDLVHPTSRTTANAIFSLGIYNGLGVASLSTTTII